MVSAQSKMNDASQGPLKEALLGMLYLMVILLITKSLPQSLIFEGDMATVAIAFQLYFPLHMIAKKGQNPAQYGIHAHGLFYGTASVLRRYFVTKKRKNGFKGKANYFDRWLASYGRGATLQCRPLSADLKRVFLTMLVTFPPFLYFYQKSIEIGRIAYHPGRSAPISEQLLSVFSIFSPHEGHDLVELFLTINTNFVLPDGFLELIIVQVGLVALPEELFYRGYILTLLNEKWPQKHFWLIPLSRAVWLCSAVFALGHFLGEWNPGRFGPFFPAFLFAALTYKGKSIFGAVVYHACCNLFSAILYATMFAHL